MSRRPSASRDQIVQAAIAVCRERGVGALTIGEVARRCRIAEGTVYNYVTGKAELLRLCAAAGGDAPAPIFERLLCERPAGRGEWMEAAAVRAVHFFRLLLPGLLVAWATPAGWRPDPAKQQRAGELLAQLILRAYPALTREDAAMLATTFLAACWYRAYTETVFHRQPDEAGDPAFARGLAAVVSRAARGAGSSEGEHEEMADG